MLQSTVLGKEVQGASRNAQSQQTQLIEERVGEQATMAERQDAEISHDESLDHNLGGCEAMNEQRLGGGKGGAPYKDSGYRQEMPSPMNGFGRWICCHLFKNRTKLLLFS